MILPVVTIVRWFSPFERPFLDEFPAVLVSCLVLHHQLQGEEGWCSDPKCRPRRSDMALKKSGKTNQISCESKFSSIDPTKSCHLRVNPPRQIHVLPQWWINLQHEHGSPLPWHEIFLGTALVAVTCPTLAATLGHFSIQKLYLVTSCWCQPPKK